MLRPNVKRGYSSNSSSSATSSINSNASTLTSPNAVSIRSGSPNGAAVRAPSARLRPSPMDELNTPPFSPYQNEFLPFPNTQNQNQNQNSRIYPLITRKNFSNDKQFIGIALYGNSIETPLEMEITEYNLGYHNDDLYKGIFNPKRVGGLMISRYPYKNGLHTIETNISGRNQNTDDSGLKEQIQAWLSEIGAPSSGGRRSRSKAKHRATKKSKLNPRKRLTRRTH